MKNCRFATDRDLIPLSRREAARRIGGWVIFAGLSGMGCAGGGKDGGVQIHVESCGTTPTGIDTGLLDTDIPVGSVAYDSANSLFVCHDADGFYAMTSICTHAGCEIDGHLPAFAPQLQSLADGFSCGCHGSRFDANGDVTQGPASSPLQHYKVSLVSNALWVDKSQSADSGLRCT